MWQVMVRGRGTLSEQAAFDTYYVRNWSVWLDLYLLARTRSRLCRDTVPTKTATTVDDSETIELTPDGRGLGVAEVTFSLIDQVSFSASHFVLNILLATWLAPRAYGSFAFGFSALLLVAAFYSAVTTEPLLMFGASRFRNRFKAYLGVLLKYHGTISLGVGLLAVLGGVGAFAFGSGDAAGALFGVAVAAPLLLLSWLLRPACMSFGSLLGRRRQVWFILGFSWSAWSLAMPLEPSPPSWHIFQWHSPRLGPAWCS